MSASYRFTAKNPNGPGRATATATGPFDQDFATLKAMYEAKGWIVTLTRRAGPGDPWRPVPAGEGTDDS